MRHRAILLLFMLQACALAAVVPVSARFEVTATWETGFNGQITLTNAADETVQDWVLEFDFDPQITTIWDARITSHSGSHYVIQSAGWNNNLVPGGTLVFGFSGTPGGLINGPTNFQVSGELGKRVAPIPPYSFKVQVYQSLSWNGGFNALLVLTNMTSERIPEWQLTIDSRQTLTRIMATWSRRGDSYLISSPGAVLLPRGSFTVPMRGYGNLTGETFSTCSVNGDPCTVTVNLSGAGVRGPAQVRDDAIVVDALDIENEAVQATLPQAETVMPLRLRSKRDARFSATVNNSSVASARIENGNLIVAGLRGGRTAVKIQDANTGTVRYLGIRVRNRDGSLPGMPDYLAIGSVSEDIPDHLEFWQSFQPGPMNKRVDVRYIYLNGGPFNGWDTWSANSGGRATMYIRNSRRLGIIPFFVYYNIPDNGESYYSNLAHVQSAVYMEAYFKNLKFMLDIINQESKDDLVGLILEPDFLGYFAQNADAAAADISAMTNAVYASGVLDRARDPAFADNVQGLVRAINYTITKYSPQVHFGWQMNLWASPAGGWTTAIPPNGIIHKTDALGVAAGRPIIYQEAAAITKYYLDAGVASYGAKFLAIDKYGLDAAGHEASAAAEPANSTWFWNNDHWLNYLAFVRAMHDTSRLPVVLWQLPVGHINTSRKLNPYSGTGLFPDLPDTFAAYEDSTGTFFFGDTFQSTGARAAFFATNTSADQSLSVNGDLITWGPHLADAAAAGVTVALFGAGVSASTTNIGKLPTDNYWWITVTQSYYENPIPLSPQ